MNRRDGRRPNTTIGPAADGALTAAQICAVCLFASKRLPYIMSFAVPCACLCLSVYTYTAALSDWTVKCAMHHGKQCPGILETVCLQAVCCVRCSLEQRCAAVWHPISWQPGVLNKPMPRANGQDVSWGLLHGKCAFLEL